MRRHTGVTFCVLAVVTMGMATQGTHFLDADIENLDEALSRADGRHGTLGSVGTSMWAQRIEQRIGFYGDVDYMHADGDVADPLPLTVTLGSGPADWAHEGTTWRPSHVEVRWSAGSVDLLERKFITADDVAVDVLTFTNNGSAEVGIGLSMEGPPEGWEALPDAPGDSPPGTGASWTAKATILGVDVCQSAAVFNAAFTLAPGESGEARAAAAFARSAETAASAARRIAVQGDPLNAHQEAWTSWFAVNCPRFDCQDEYLKKLWYYRWFVVRHNLSEPDAGLIREPVFFEGRHEGHFPRLITFSAPHIVMETRWLADPKYARGVVRTLLANAAEDGSFRSVRVDKVSSFYTNWTTATAWDLHMVHPDTSFLSESVEGLAANVKGLADTYDTDDDFMLSPPNHWRTGMEWQPSFWYFNDYDASEKENETALERVDFTCYLYANAVAVAEMYDALGEADKASAFRARAEQIRAAVLDSMWDGKDAFFFSLRESDNEPARVKEIVGFYPFAFRLAPAEGKYNAAFKALPDRTEFWTTWPLATASKKCPAFSAHIADWHTSEGGSGCCWNGPTWPHANSVAIEAAANAVRLYEAKMVTPGILHDLLYQYALLQFEDQDIAKPMVQEYYDGVTGRADGCYDYFHSTYNDLVIRMIGGLVPRNDDILELDPVSRKLDHFMIENIPYRGHLITLVWDSADREPAYEGIPEGFTIFIDGERAISFPWLIHVTYNLDTGEVDLHQKDPIFE